MLHAFCVKIFHFQWLKLNFVSLHGCNVSASLKIIDATFSETPPERYWELLAEERRLALQNALEENERVGSELYSTLFHFWNIQCLAVIILPFFFFTQLHKELEELKERNKALEEVAGQAEYFASLYQVSLGWSDVFTVWIH